MALGSPLQPLAFPGAPGLLSPHRPVWDAKQEAEGKERGAAGRGAPGAAPRFEGAAAALPPALGRGGGSAGPARWGCPEPGLPPVRSTPRHPLWAGEPKAARFRPEEAAGRAEPAPSGGEDSAAQLAISKRANCRAGAWAGKHKAEITRWVPGEIKGACCRSRRHTQRCHRGRCARPRASGGSGCNSPAPTALAANTAPGTPRPNAAALQEGDNSCQRGDAADRPCLLQRHGRLHGWGGHGAPPAPRPPPASVASWGEFGEFSPRETGKNPSACLSLRNGAKPEPRLPGSENWVPSSEPHGPRALRPPPPAPLPPLRAPQKEQEHSGLPTGAPEFGPIWSCEGLC